MTAVRAGDVERAVRSRGPDVNLILFYGPDAGLVAERARAAAMASVPDPADPFQLIRHDGDLLADEPSRLVEEATTYGLFSGRRAIWVRPTGRNLAPAVAPCLAVALSDTTVILEAGDLRRSAPLVALCESSPRALACPCYADDRRDLATLVTDTLRASGLTVDDDARDLLIEHVGADRLATRAELAKLALYAHGTGRVTAEDVDAVVSDVSAPGLDAAIDAAFAGDRAALEAALGQIGRQGTAPAAILALALRHAFALINARIAVEAGGDLDGVIRGWRGLHFRRRDRVRLQVTRWRVAPLRRALALLQAAVLNSRRHADLGSTLVAQGLFEIAALSGGG